MTHRAKINGTSILVIDAEPDGICELCGKKKELRPYGPKGENICFPCGMKDEVAMDQAIKQRLSPN